MPPCQDKCEHNRPSAVPEKARKAPRILGALLVGLIFPLLAAVTDAQEPRWSPRQGSRVTLIDLAGRPVATNPLRLATPDPWEGKRWPDCGAPNIDLYAQRYLGDNRELFTQGHNCTGFQNELAFLGSLAVKKAVGDSGYDPLCMEVTDFNCTHARTCSAYGLTFEDGCGGGPVDPVDEGGGLPKRLVDYCIKFGWTAPGHRGPEIPACKALRGCERGNCPCFTERRSTVAAGGSFVSFDPTKPECRPDRLVDETPPVEPERPPVAEPPTGGSSTCDEALEELDRAARDLDEALKQARRVCSVGG